MSVIPSDIVIYGSASMPEADASAHMKFDDAVALRIRGDRADGIMIINDDATFLVITRDRLN